MLRDCLQGLRIIVSGKRGLSLLLASDVCKGSIPREARCSDDGDCWHSFCPCCKRPVEIHVGGAPAEGRSSEAPAPAAAGTGYAYVVGLWGRSPEYCLGAMVLAKSLRKLQTPHDLMLLHTSDVPPAALQLLSRSGWQLMEVDPIQGVSELYNNGEPRFDGVFTKLRALGLTQYKKILFMDIDTLVRRSIDDLFELPAPAAMARGPGSGYRHGEAIDGRYFFCGGGGGGRSWGQAWGINAGVMLWEPSEADLRQMLSEVLDRKHPSHVRGNGPEQDYLSRYWANKWTHIGCEYNYQLHQMYFSLNPDYLNEASYLDRNRFFYEQPAGSGIRVIHYSGHLKPWSRFLSASQWAPGADGDAAFAKEVVESFPGYWVWVQPDPQTWANKQPLHGLVLGPNGVIRRIDYSRWQDGGYDAGASRWTDADLGEEDGDGGAEWREGVRDAAMGEDSAVGGAMGDHASGYDASSYWPLGEEVHVPEAASQGARSIVENSLAQWNEVYRELQAEFGMEDLAKVLHEAYSPQSPALPEPEASKEADAVKPGWGSSGGWWVDAPVLRRASVLAGCTPELTASFSVQGESALDLRGVAAAGVHGVGVVPNGDRSTLTKAVGDDLETWAAGLPEGTLVLLALADVAPEVLAAVSAACAKHGIAVAEGAPLAAALPNDCRVAAVAGVKGRPSEAQTMAACDFAIATLPLPDLRASCASASAGAPAA